MVIRKAPIPSEPPPYPDTPLDSRSSPFTSNVQARESATLSNVQDGIADLSFYKENDGVEESSDWDASDREDFDTQKMVDDRPEAARTVSDPNRQQPKLRESEIPEPLRLYKPSTPQQSQAKITPILAVTSPQSPPPARAQPSDTQNEPTSPSSRPNTNPFRRPSDFKPAEPLANSAAVWRAEDAEAKERRHMEEAYGAEPTANPWQEESQRPFLSSEAPLHATQPVANPWAASATQMNNTSHVDGFPQEPTQAVTQDTSYIAPLIDLGTRESEQPMSKESNERQPKVEMPQGTLSQQQSTQVVETPRTKANGQRNEYYQIKHVRWHDPKAKKNPRQSPILTQNANGPCPLLALVNALSLSTPPDLQTPLIETLRTREQVSLGLLLDAVFDELMSGRRGATAQQLPDVGELYSFLVTLHTGMNVNPRFVHDTHNGHFEQTKEMLLYSTFAIPLLHGWIPDPASPAHAAFASTAPSYEDAQNVQFREEELEQKLGTATLSHDEQSLLRDLPVIKQFLITWPTQLTEHGLNSLHDSLDTGAIAILFRNDHFSTLYKEPRKGQLMTLVTDAGYAAHDEIVWESLVDVNGARAELFSGDFRSVSHTASSPQHASEADWQTVPPRHTRQQPTSTAPQTEVGTEQTDADLALALQLQEEEEEAQRNQAAARRREERLSETYLDHESARSGPQIPPRRRRPRGTERERSDELPSYEQVAATSSGRGGQRVGLGRVPGAGRGSAVAAAGTGHAGAFAATGAGGHVGGRRGRRQPTPFDVGNASNVQSAEAVGERREGCAVM